MDDGSEDGCATEPYYFHGHTGEEESVATPVISVDILEEMK